MKAFAFRIVQSLLCIIAGGLISIIELRFFGDIAFPSAYAIIIPAVTVFAVFLYARSENSVIFVFIYTVCLTFILEVLNNQLDIIVLLGCFFVLVLLCALTLFRRSFIEGRAAITAHGLNFLTALICALIVVFVTFRFYTGILLPRLEDEKNTLVLPSNAPVATEELPMPPPTPESLDTQARQDDSPADIIPPDPPRGLTAAQIVLIAAGIIAIILIAAALYRHGKYKRWFRKILASPPDEQLMRLYPRLLYLLAVCGYPRRDCETPSEYLRNTDASGFPLPALGFNELTAAFAAAHYGGKDVTASERDNCLALFRSLPALVKATKGRGFYYLRYIPKCRRELK